MTGAVNGALTYFDTVIPASFATSVLWAVGMVVAAWPPSRIAFLFRNVENILLSAGYWGIVWGWMSALVAVLVLRRQPRTEPALPTVRPRGRMLGIGVVAILAAGLVAAAPRATSANRAANLPNIGAPNIGAPNIGAPDNGAVKPPAPSEPPVIYGSPTVASSAESAESDWCHGDQVSILVGQTDAATCHRALGIRLANVTEQLCVLGAYPDIAFDGATGWAMEVSVFRGGTFMTKDAGVSAFTVQPGESATASLGWNAMAPAGSTWAGTILFAPYAGTERHKVPAELDIVNGGVAAVTAWSNALDIE